jgi:hypothetical protein
VEKPQHLLDIETLSAMDLRDRYSPEANTHRNMKLRAKRRGNVIHPAFEEFASFLAHVGPKPFPEATLDRIDNNDLEYGPGKVRWADRHTQNSNKSDNLFFISSSGARTYTAAQLAEFHGITADAIRKRKERGWSDDDIIAGRRIGNMPNFISMTDAELFHFRPWLVPSEEQTFQAKKVQHQAPMEFAARFYTARLTSLREHVEAIEEYEGELTKEQETALAKHKETARIVHGRLQYYRDLHTAWKAAWHIRRPSSDED